MNQYNVYIEILENMMENITDDHSFVDNFDSHQDMI